MPKPRIKQSNRKDLNMKQAGKEGMPEKLMENRSIFDCEPENSVSLDNTNDSEHNSEEGKDKGESNGLTFEKIKHINMSDSESDSSLDEHLRSPTSLQNLDNFYEKENLKRDDSDVDDIKMNSESEGNLCSAPNEYFDFSNILKSQQILKDLSDQNCNAKLKSEISASTTLEKVQCKKELDNLNVSELLAIGETDLTHESEKSEDENDGGKDGYPSESVQITIQLPDANKKKKKKRVDLEAALRRQLNAVKRENQVYIHKVHLLCLFAHGIYLNKLLNTDDLLGVASSIIPSQKLFPPKHADISYLERLVDWFAKKFKLVLKSNVIYNPTERIISQFASKEVICVKDLVLMFVCLARVLGLKCRLMMSLQPLPLKPPSSVLYNLSQDSLNTKNRKKTNLCDVELENKGQSSDVKKERNVSLKRTQPNTKSSENKESSFKKIKTVKKITDAQGDEGTKINSFTTVKTETPKKAKRSKKGETTLTVPLKTSKRSLKSAEATNIKDKRGIKHNVTTSVSANTPRVKNQIDRKILSESEEEKNSPSEKKKKEKVDTWAEVFVESEEKWISVDVQKAKVHCINDLYNGCTHPVCYVLGWNNDQTVKDLTRRYAPQWMTVTQKIRVDNAWWEEMLSPWKPNRTAEEKEEDYDLDKILQDKPLPTSISEYKSHPLYALKRHLLKFEAIYPPDAPTLGFIKSEPVYSRLCVHELHSRETWMRQAKLVRRNETPYKVVKARPKFDKVSGTTIKDLPLELFGHWQVDDYIAPPAVEGKVPRNEYGNVELYKPCMLPAGTVHLQVPGLNRVARKLDIDCAPAVVGWEFHSGGSHPILDGFVVCEEFKDVLLDAWNKDIDESARRNREKIEQRVYKNWKRLIRGLQIRERLELRYKFGLMPSASGNSKTKPLKRKHK